MICTVHSICLPYALPYAKLLVENVLDKSSSHEFIVANEHKGIFLGIYSNSWCTGIIGLSLPNISRITMEQDEKDDESKTIQTSETTITGTVDEEEKDEENKGDEKLSDPATQKETVEESEHSVGQSVVGTDATSAGENTRRTDSQRNDDTTVNFPRQLMDILDTESDGYIISWLPHGGAFRIYNREAFEKEILPKYFEKQSKFASFTRKLNRWGFSRLVKGPEAGAYYHPQFKRGEHELCKQIYCSNNKNKISKASTNVARDAPASSIAYHAPPLGSQYGQQLHYPPYYNPMSMHQQIAAYQPNPHEADLYDTRQPERYSATASDTHSYQYYTDPATANDTHSYQQYTGQFYQHPGQYIHYQENAPRQHPMTSPGSQPNPYPGDTNYHLATYPPPPYDYHSFEERIPSTRQNPQPPYALEQTQHPDKLAESSDECKEENQYA